MKALIIDDEPSAVDTLSLMIYRYVPEITELRNTTSPTEGLHLLKTWDPDILFLDIQMPLMNGFDILRQFPQINFTIVFATAYDQYAIQAIRFSALDYLLKPIDADELRAAVDKHIARVESQKSMQLVYDNLLHNLSVTNKNEFKLAIASTQGTAFYIPSEIIRLEAESNYTKFYFTQQRPILTSRTLKEYDELLSGHGFLRIHKSHLINKQHVCSFTRDGIVTMTDGSLVEISRRRREVIISALTGKHV